MLSLIPILLVNLTTSAELDRDFRSAWANNKAIEACARLDELVQNEMPSGSSLKLGLLARTRCARMAINQKRWEEAGRQLDAYKNMGGEPEAIANLLQEYAAAMAVRLLRAGEAPRAVVWLEQVREREYSTENLGAQMALTGLAAVEREEMDQALFYLTQLERLAPDQLMLPELRRAIWWNKTGRFWALLLAAASFGLLVVLTTINLMRTKRRERAVLRSEV